MPLNATSLFRAMANAICGREYSRLSADAASPNQKATIEAAPGHVFTLDKPDNNVVLCRKVDLRWATANVLQFFAGTEEASWLRKYNRHADRFLTGTRWIGAYGAIAMPQLQTCIARLKASPNTRRAYVDMGPLAEEDVNRPPCWNLLHFLVQYDAVHMQVYQRSLNLFGVMPYDCVVLTNILSYVAKWLELRPGTLTWQIGSLHCLPTDALPIVDYERQVYSLILPHLTLSDPEKCKSILQDPTCAIYNIRKLLETEHEEAPS